jgi:hypothetical protein
LEDRKGNGRMQLRPILGGSYKEETSCVKSVACNKFHVNSFLPINTHEEVPWFSLRHVIRRGEGFVPLAMLTVVKNKKTVFGYVTSTLQIYSAVHIYC